MMKSPRFAVNQHLLNGFQLNARLQRQYPFGEEMVHVVGYVGRISEDDLQRINRSAYRGTDYIGKLGIEAHYERTLLGHAGYEQVETNAHGRVVRTLSRVSPYRGQGYIPQRGCRFAAGDQGIPGRISGLCRRHGPQYRWCAGIRQQPGVRPESFCQRYRLEVLSGGAPARGQTPC